MDEYSEEIFIQAMLDWEDSLNTMVTVHDKDFNIVKANKSAEKILGLPFSRISREKCYVTYHGSDRPPDGCPSCECLKTGESASCDIFEPHLNMFLNIKAIPRFDDNGEINGLVHVVRDITERKQAEDQLKAAIKKSEDEKVKTAAILDAIGDLISIQDKNFKVIYQNKRHRDFIGDRTGEYCYRAYQDKDHVCDGCHLAMSFRDGKIHTVERSRNTDKGKMYSLNTASLLKDSTGETIAGIEIIRDITKRKMAEKSLQNAHDELDQRVKERTADLSKVNTTLLSEINERKKIEEEILEAERMLKMHAIELRESNTALKVLLKQRERDQGEFENNILSNIKQLIMPYIEKLKKNRAMSDELVYLNMIEANLKEIVSPFSSKLSYQYMEFTPKEILVANLIKEGKQDKDIMEILNVSLETVKSHRQNIRKKLGIYGKRTNLRTTLISYIK